MHEDKDKESTPVSGEKDDCCHVEPSHDAPAKSRDWLLYSSFLILLSFYLNEIFHLKHESSQWYGQMSASVFELVNMMWWGIALGVLMMSLLAKIPRELVIYVLGSKGGSSGIVRATLAGVLLDLCSHGILLVAATLYERGVSIGQVMAFLIASPWNSFTFTLILIALVGWPWTLAFIVISMLIAIASGLIFNLLVNSGVIPANPNKVELGEDFKFWGVMREQFTSTDFSAGFFADMLWQGLKKSKMVMRWILFGIVLASLIRTFVSLDYFQNYFGPTLLGLSLTVMAATIIEVCSEGSVPIAADLLNRANAPGNGFAFLMTGVSTDYTEIMVLKDTTGRWLIALLLPLVTLPQVIFIAWLMNYLS